ncbi:Endocytosis and vacuole integrity protein [Batrachochytrium dendrobatidis]|nr:Endocytosis and vacuole integrity protein [Batrachochytrium dendrobatidis]
MSGLVATLQNDLVALSNEAKRKNPEIKEAAERLLYLLRSLKDRQAALPPGAPDTLTADLANTDDTVKPFIMSCDTKNPKLIPIAISCLQKLISHHAVPESSTSLILKTLSDQVGSTMELQLKILQTILPLITNYHSVHGEVLADALLLCYRLQDTKTPVVNSTAAATFRQLVIYAFEKLSIEDFKINSPEPRPLSSTAHNAKTPTERLSNDMTSTPLTSNAPKTELSSEYAQYVTDAFMIFQDLCLLASGEQGTFLRVHTMSKGFCLELVESILSGNHEIFTIHPQLLSLLKDKICPLVIKAFSEKNDFSMTVRLMRVLQVIIKNFHLVLVMECEIFMSLYAKLLESETIAVWQRVLVLEAVHNLFSDATLQRSIFEMYDAKEHSTRIFFDTTMAIAKFIFAERAYLVGAPNGSDGPKGDLAITPIIDLYSVSMASASLKIQCLDQFDKTEPPLFPETYPLFVAMQCILSTVDNVTGFVLPVLGAESVDLPELGSMEYLGGSISEVASLAPVDANALCLDGNDRKSYSTSKNDQILLSIELVKASSPSLLAILTLLSTSSIDDDLFSWVLQSFQNYTVVVGLLGLTSHCDAFLSAMCKVCIPSSSSVSFDFATIANDVTPFNLVLLHGSSRSTGPALLTDRNVTCLRVLLGVAESIAPVMNSRTWLIVFETLQIADGLMSSGKMGKRMESSPGFLELTSSVSTSTAKDSPRHRSTTFSNLLHSGSPFSPTGLSGGHGVPGNTPAVTNVPSQSVTVENNFATFSAFVKRVFERTVSMELKHLQEFIRALCRLSHDTMTGVIAAPLGGPALGREGGKTVDDKLFAVTKLHDVAIVNVRRLITESDFDAWDLLISQLIQMAHTQSCSSAMRAHICHTFGEIIIAAMQMADLSNPVVEMKLLEPIRKMMAAEMVLSDPQTKDGVLTEDRVERLLKLSWLVEVQKSVLETLEKLLQIGGQNLLDGWMLVFDVLQNVVRLSKVRRALRPGGPGVISNAETPAKLNELGPSSQQQSSSETVQFGTGFGDTPMPSRSSAIVRIGFPCIQLICTDFLALLKPAMLLRCIETVTTFGSLSDDLNISLASVGLLWTICDFILTKRQELERLAVLECKEKSASTLELVKENTAANLLSASDSELGVIADNPAVTKDTVAPESIASDKLDLHMLSGKLTTKTLDTLWMYLLENLSELCSDECLEVRNSANQTLFRTLAMNGQRLTLIAWDQCVWQILFPLLERIQMSSTSCDMALGGNLLSAGLMTSTTMSNIDLKRAISSTPIASAQNTHTAIGSSVDPSRVTSPQIAPRTPIQKPNSNTKSWDATKVLTLNGVTKCFLDFLHVLVNLGESFDKAWIHILEYITTTCLQGSPEVSMAALKNLRLIIQYARQGATKPIPENVVPRVMDMWLKVWQNWVDIGMGIIESADHITADIPTGNLPSNFVSQEYLQSVDAPYSATSTLSLAQVNIACKNNLIINWSDGSTAYLLNGYFTQETLTTYMSIFVDLYEIIKPEFTLNHLCQFSLISRKLLIYHSIPILGTSANKIRVDFVNDQENLTPLQASVLDVISETKVNFSTVETSVDILLLLVADILKMPYVSMSLGLNAPSTNLSGTTPNTNVLLSPVMSTTVSHAGATNISLKFFTFVALTKRTMQLLVLNFQTHGLTRRSIYQSGAFEMCLDGLHIPMQLKYACPSPGVKDSTPIWRCAATAAMTIIGIGMQALNQYSKDLDAIKLDTIYNAVWSLLGDFLLQSSSPSASVSSDELSADEAFDVSIITTVEQDILQHLSQPHVSDSHILRLLEILKRGSRLYVYPATTFSGINMSMSPLALPESATNDVSIVLDTPLGEDKGKPSVLTEGLNPGAPTLGFDIKSQGRENFAFSCLKVLFSLCSNTLSDANTIDTDEKRMRIAELAVPYLIDTCKEVIQSYCKDRPLYGQLPLPRLRTTELKFVLESIGDLQMSPRILHKYYEIDELDVVKWKLLSGESAHIFMLYDQLCDILGVVSGISFGMPSSQAAGNHILTESALIDTIKRCLKRISQEFLAVPRIAT